MITEKSAFTQRPDKPRKISKNTREGVTKKNFSQVEVRSFLYPTCSLYLWTLFTFRGKNFYIFLFRQLKLKLFRPLPLFHIPMGDRQRVAKCMRL